MMKKILAGTVALTLAGAGLALAQSDRQSDPQSNRARSHAERNFQPSDEDIAAFSDARIAALKAGLKLTAEQEKQWPAVETAIRDLAKQRSDRMKERADRTAERRAARASGTVPPRPDMIDRLRRGADAMTTRPVARSTAITDHVANAGDAAANSRNVATRYDAGLDAMCESRP